MHNSLKSLVAALLVCASASSMAAYRMQFASHGLKGGHSQLQLGPLDFGSVQVGGFKRQKATLTNPTSKTISFAGLVPSVLTFQGATFSYPSSAGTLIKGTCASLTSLAAGASCTVGISFMPTEVGVASGKMTITASDGAVSAILSGMGALPAALSFSATAVDFGTIATNSENVRQVTLTNSGGMPLMSLMPSVTFSNNAYGSVSGCPSSLDPGASCVLSVTLYPGFGDISGTVSIASNAGTSSVPLTAFGAGSEASPAAATYSVSASVGAAAPTVVIPITSAGNLPLTITGLSSLPAPFSLVGNTCSNIAPGGSCQLTLSLSTGTAGQWNTSAPYTYTQLTGDSTNTSVKLVGTVTAN